MMAVPVSNFRPEIQGLRAIAVSLVLVFHLWPAALPGGFIGVDVFFVISGYLISSLLIRELERTGTISFSAFYLRRARRLLPASLLTLAAVLVATFLLLPKTSWRDVALEVGASALYFENWWLAANAVDYLANESGASPVQHFWSLSVEEQFYFFWPVVLFAAASLARRIAFRYGARVVCTWVLLAIVASSLAYSIYTGLQGEPAAYFSTFTRIWQLGAGALLAMHGVPQVQGRAWILVAGLVAIAASAVLISGETAYPGFAALLPTVGAWLALYGGRSYADSPLSSWLAGKPVQYVGDISYSLYLWHWPVIVFAQHYWGAEKELPFLLGLLLVSLVLAAASKRFIEDPFRSHGAQKSVFGQWGWIGASSGACLLIAFGLYGAAGPQASEPAPQMNYPGAGVLVSGSAPAPIVNPPFLPALVNVESDVATSYAEGCIQNSSGSAVKTCKYGPDDAKLRIAVIGDSHAVHWLPAFQEMQRYWDMQVVGITKTSCTPAGIAPYNRRLKRPYTECKNWTRNVIAYVNREDFDLIVLSQSPKHMVHGKQAARPAGSAAEIADGLATVWADLGENSKKIRVIRPTPWQPTLVRECAAEGTPPFDSCVGLPSEVFFDDAMVRLARIAGFPLLDFTDMFCPGDKCPAVIGNVFVYRDAHHITASYMRTLAGVLEKRLGLNPAYKLANAASGTAAYVDPQKLTPIASAAAKDRSRVFSDRCVQSLKNYDAKPCVYGVATGSVRIAVVGDSTGANLMPALEKVAEKNGWRLEVYFKDSCLFGSTSVYHRLLKRAFDECSRWGKDVRDDLLSAPPDLVVFAQSPEYRDPKSKSVEAAAMPLGKGMAQYWSQLQRAGIDLAAIQYTPWLPFDIPQCIQVRGDAGQCSASRDVSLRDGALSRAMEIVPGVELIDLTNDFCTPVDCPATKDGFIIYRDASQPTATFARSLGLSVGSKIKLVLAKDTGSQANFRQTSEESK